MKVVQTAVSEGLSLAARLLDELARRLRSPEIGEAERIALSGAVAEFQKRLQQAGYYAGAELATEVYLLLRSLEWDADSIRTMILQGLPGTGKTSLATAFYQVVAERHAKEGGAALLVAQVTSDLHGKNLLDGPLNFRIILSESVRVPPEVLKDKGRMSRAQKLETYRTQLYNMGFLRAAAQLSQRGVYVVLVLNEMDKARAVDRFGAIQRGPNLIEEFLLEVLQTGRLPIVGEKAERAMDVRKVALFIAMNYNSLLSPEVVRRARCVSIGFLPRDREVQVLAKSMPTQLAVFLVDRIAEPLRREAHYLTWRSPDIGELSIVPPLDVLRGMGQDLMTLAHEDQSVASLRKLVPRLMQARLVASPGERGHLNRIIPSAVFSQELVNLLVTLNDAECIPMRPPAPAMKKAKG